MAHPLDLGKTCQPLRQHHTSEDPTCPSLGASHFMEQKVSKAIGSPRNYAPVSDYIPGIRNHGVPCSNTVGCFQACPLEAFTHMYIPRPTEWTKVAFGWADVGECRRILYLMGGYLHNTPASPFMVWVPPVVWGMRCGPRPRSWDLSFRFPCTSEQSKKSEHSKFKCDYPSHKEAAFVKIVD